MTNSNDVLNYLSHLKDIKAKLGPAYQFHKEDDLYIIFDESSLPVLSLTQKNFEIFQEIEV